MRLLPTLCLLALTPNVALGACNADNVLRALQRYSAQASPFCSTYTQPPPNQPLPTYVSQYPASRVSSGCSCLITSTPTPTSPPTPTPTPDDCKSDRITNGNFETIVNNQAASWSFPGEVRDPSNPNLYTNAFTSTTSTGNHLAYLLVYNNLTRTFSGQTTSITQNTKPFCGGTYKLTYTSKIIITGGEYRGPTCSVFITLGGQELVHIGPPSGDPPPFDFQTRSTTFTAASGSQTFRVALQCDATQGDYQIDDISIVGV